METVIKLTKIRYFEVSLRLLKMNVNESYPLLTDWPVISWLLSLTDVL